MMAELINNFPYFMTIYDKESPTPNASFYTTDSPLDPKRTIRHGVQEEFCKKENGVLRLWDKRGPFRK